MAGTASVMSRQTTWTPGQRLDRRPAQEPDDKHGPIVGVLALQGDVLEHMNALARCGAQPVQVKAPARLDEIDGLVIPGGESTTIGKLLVLSGMLEAIRARLRGGLCVLGTCAGMILLSDELDQDEAQPLVGGLAIRTRRNAFGRQRESFDASIDVRGIDGGPLDVAFIRAPRVEHVLDDSVEILADVQGYPVVVRQGNVLACAFHPELTGDDRIHRLFVDTVAATAARR